MNARITPIDGATDLLILDDGTYGIRWAGCFYGPAKELTEICEGDLLEQCRQAAQRPLDRWQRGRTFDPDDGLGVRWIEQTEEHENQKDPALPSLPRPNLDAGPGDRPS